MIADNASPELADIRQLRAGIVGDHVLQMCIRDRAKRLYSFTLPPEDQRRMGLAAESYVRAMLERAFRTLDFYKSLRVMSPTPKEGKTTDNQ